MTREVGIGLLVGLLAVDVLLGILACRLELKRARAGSGPSAFPPILFSMYWAALFVPSHSPVFNLAYGWSGTGVLRVVESTVMTVVAMWLSMTIAMIGPKWVARKIAGEDPGEFWSSFNFWKRPGAYAGYPGALRATDFFERAQDALGFVTAAEESDDDRKFIQIWISARPQSVTMPIKVNGRPILRCKLVRGSSFATGELYDSWVVVVQVFEELSETSWVELTRNGEEVRILTSPTHDPDIWSNNFYAVNSEAAMPQLEVERSMRLEFEEHDGEIPIPGWCTHVLIEQRREGYVAVFGEVGNKPGEA